MGRAVRCVHKLFYCFDLFYMQMNVNMSKSMGSNASHSHSIWKCESTALNTQKQ